MSIAYHAKISKQDGGYLVEFPDLPGCFTEGDTIAEALENAKEALSGYLYAVIKAGDEIPEPDVHKGRQCHLVEPDLDVAVPLMLLMARKQKGLTQADMAKELKITQQAYRKLEIPGKSNPGIKTLSRLFDKLGLRLELKFAA
jgi:antitoxin HicB